MNGTKIALLALCALIILSVGGCKTEPVADAPDMAMLRILVHYNELLLLPPNCELTVSMQNVSQLNATSNTIASRTVTVQAGPPYEVLLQYDPLRVDKRLSYALSARIELAGQVLFASTDRINPFAGPAGKPVQILVQRVKH